MGLADKKPKALTKEQKSFLKHLEISRDLALSIAETGVTSMQIAQWRKDRVEFHKSFLKLIGISETQEEFLNSLHKLAGNISATCDAVGITRRTYQYWKDGNDEFAAMLMEIREAIIDSVETILMRKIRQEDTTSIIFWLKTQAKHRGYIERQDSVVQQTTEHSFKNMSDEDLDAMLKKLEK